MSTELDIVRGKHWTEEVNETADNSLYVGNVDAFMEESQVKTALMVFIKRKK